MALLCFLMGCCLLVSPLTRADTINIPAFAQGSVGTHTQYFRERDGVLVLSEAQQRFAAGPLTTGSSNSISLGISVDPVWMTFTVSNTAQFAKAYRLSVETPWIDYIDTWLIQDGIVKSVLQAVMPTRLKSGRWLTVIMPLNMLILRG